MSTSSVVQLETGDHASRPSAGTVPAGTLYSCTDHGLVYQSDGVSSWSTYFDPNTTPAGSGLVLLEQHTASASASLDFTTCISATYDDYVIRLLNIVPATNAAILRMRVSTDGGSTYDSTAIYDHGGGYSYSGGQGNVGAVDQAQWEIAANVSNSANYGLSGEYMLIDPARTSGYKHMHGHRAGLDTSVSLLVWSHAHFTYKSTTAVDAFQFYFSSGNIASGTIRVYGVKK